MSCNACQICRHTEEKRKRVGEKLDLHSQKSFPFTSNKREFKQQQIKSDRKMSHALSLHNTHTWMILECATRRGIEMYQNL